MIVEQRRRTVRLATALGIVAMSLACASAPKGADPSLRGVTAIDRQIQGSGFTAPRLDHIMPARDSQGSLPKRFEWTAVPGAETYSIGVWNEVDMLIWRKDQIPTNFYVPTDLRLEPGTYFWTISAIRGGEEMTASGLSAFVVRPSDPQ